MSGASGNRATTIIDPATQSSTLMQKLCNIDAWSTISTKRPTRSMPFPIFLTHWVTASSMGVRLGKAEGGQGLRGFLGLRCFWSCGASEATLLPGVTFLPEDGVPKVFPSSDLPALASDCSVRNRWLTGELTLVRLGLTNPTESCSAFPDNANTCCD